MIKVRKTVGVKRVTKSNVSGTAFKSNNAIQNVGGLTKVDYHNYRLYDNKQGDTLIIRGTSSQVDDVKKLYIEEFEKEKDGFERGI